eukprot:15330936-Ditylum_brightwellii.AAC.1
MMLHDRKIYLDAINDNMGELVFSHHPAWELLWDDMKMKCHESMTPSQLQATRSEYELFKLSVFRGCIKQEIRCQKYINYLENKQTEKQRKFAEDKAKKEAKAKKEVKGKEAPKNAGNSRKRKVAEKAKS